MAYRGHIRNGVVELDEPASFPEGAEVSVDLVPASRGAEDNGGDHSDKEQDRIPSLYEQFKDIVGIVPESLPEDLARNHDHYLYGTRKDRVGMNPRR